MNNNIDNLIEEAGPAPDPNSPPPPPPPPRGASSGPTHTRTGKIARLPRAVRDQLNQRLDDGQPAKQLVAWLNSLPEVQAVLAAEFHAHPVTEGNLTHWRHGGFADWQRLQDQRFSLSDLAEQADVLRSASPGTALAEKLSP